MNIEKCKNCKHAYFDVRVVGGKMINGKPQEIWERVDEYPSSCGYGLDGAMSIDKDSYCPKPSKIKLK